jgi:hypothetical protein
MTEAEFWELIRRSWQGIPLNEAQKEAIREYLRERMSPDAIRAFEKDFVSKPPPPSSPWWSRFFKPGNIARGGLYLALAYLLVAAVADRYVEPTQISSGNGPCKINAGSVALHVDPSSTGPNGALKAAMDELAVLCGTSSLNCSGGTCPTCAPDVAVQTVNVKTRIFWYTADVTAICQCWCK